MSRDPIVTAEVVHVKKRGKDGADITIQAMISGKRVTGEFWASPKVLSSYTIGKKVKAAFDGKRLILANNP